MLTKSELNKINESLSVNVGDIIFIHHPITEELVKVNVEKVKTSNLEVSIPEDSDYFGQPNFEIKKYKVISIL